MLFDVWGSNTGIHWLGWAMVFIGLIVLNHDHPHSGWFALRV